MRIATLAQLAEYREQLSRARNPKRPCVTVCGGTGCRAYGAEEVLAAARASVDGKKAAVRMTGCHGFCEKGPVVVVQPAGIFYSRVEPKDMPEIVKESVAHKRVVKRLLYTDPATGDKVTHEHEVPFYAKQMRLLLNQNGLLDPTSIDEYIALNGYDSLAKGLIGTPASALKSKGTMPCYAEITIQLCQATSSVSSHCTTTKVDYNCSSASATKILV